MGRRLVHLFLLFSGRFSYIQEQPLDCGLSLFLFSWSVFDYEIAINKDMEVSICAFNCVCFLHSFSVYVCVVCFSVCVADSWVKPPVV